MINLKDPKDQLPSLLAIVGMLGLAASAVHLLFFKPYNAAALKKKIKEEQSKLIARNDVAKAGIAEATTKIGMNLWMTRLDEVTPMALSKVTKLSEANKVTMVSFRPQKPTEGTVLLQQPYVLTVDGPFTNVANLINQIEKGGTKLAVSQIQFASTEGETDVVSAQIGLVAYLNKPSNEPTEKSMSKKSTTQTDTKPVLDSTSKVPGNSKTQPVPNTQSLKAGTTRG